MGRAGRLVAFVVGAHGFARILVCENQNYVLCDLLGRIEFPPCLAPGGEEKAREIFFIFFAHNPLKSPVSDE